MAQSLETPPAPVPGKPLTTPNRELDEKAWNIPRQAPVAPAADSISHGSREEALDWKASPRRTYLVLADTN